MRPPVALEHAGKVSARQPHARHHIDLEEAAPVLVGDLEEILRLEDAGIVDEDIDIGQRLDEHGAAFGSRDIGSNAADLGSRYRLLDPGDSSVDLLLAAAVDDDIGAG